MAVVNGVVGNNTRRKLNVEEFRGFSLCDAYAPLIFVHGSDAKAAKMGALAHELAHIWLGNPGRRDIRIREPLPRAAQRWRHFATGRRRSRLLPAGELRAQWGGVKYEPQPFKILAHRFKVSPIVAGRRALNLRLVDREAFFGFYDEYVREERRQGAGTGGGDFYNNQNARVGEAFAT